jgi:hypothetical protein
MIDVNMEEDSTAEQKRQLQPLPFGGNPGEMVDIHRVRFAGLTMLWITG